MEHLKKRQKEMTRANGTPSKKRFRGQRSGVPLKFKLRKGFILRFEGAVSLGQDKLERMAR